MKFDEKLHDSSLKPKTKQGFPILPPLFSIILEFPRSK